MQVLDGVTPNQYGTWYFGRGGWCPGLEVAMWQVDLTPWLGDAFDHTLDYDAGVAGQTPWTPTSNGQGSYDGNIRATIYLVQWAPK